MGPIHGQGWAGAALAAQAARRAARHGACGLAVVLLAAGAAGPVAAQPAEGAFAPPALAMPLRRWQIDADFKRKTEARDISAMACVPARGLVARQCLLVSDGVRHVRRVTLEGHAIEVGGRLDLLNPSNTDGPEVDAEGATFLQQPDGRAYYYVTGSHGASRGDGSLQPARFNVFRIPVDLESGAPGRAQASGALKPIIDASPVLKDKACVSASQCPGLETGGANIEGLAAKGEDLYFGFRAPTRDGRAVVLRVPADALFAAHGAAPAVQILRPQLGAGFGIRDIVAVKGGFLILAGFDLTDEGKVAYPSLIHFWDGVSVVTRPLAVLATPFKKSGPVKAEGLLVLDDDEAGGLYRLLILFDSAKGGAPTEYAVPRP